MLLGQELHFPDVLIFEAELSLFFYDLDSIWDIMAANLLGLEEVDLVDILAYVEVPRAKHLVC